MTWKEHKSEETSSISGTAGKSVYTLESGEPFYFLGFPFAYLLHRN